MELQLGDADQQLSAIDRRSVPRAYGSSRAASVSAALRVRADLRRVRLGSRRGRLCNDPDRAIGPGSSGYPAADFTTAQRAAAEACRGKLNSCHNRLDLDQDSIVSPLALLSWQHP